MNISVIIPVYNRTDLLERALRSVLAQTYTVSKIIIVDDGSDTATQTFISALVEKLQISAGHFYGKSNAGKISLYSLSAHTGMAGAVRNFGIAKVQTDWIALLDSDDTWHANKIALQVSELTRSKLLWCHTKEIWQRNGKTISQNSQKHVRQGNIFCDALIKCIVGPSTVLIHKSMFEKFGLFREDLEIAEDYELWLRFAYKENISYIDTPLVIKYAGLGDNLSEKYDYIEKFRINALQQLIDKHYFEGDNLALATKELARKTLIWQLGKQKRKV